MPSDSSAVRLLAPAWKTMSKTPSPFRSPVSNSSPVKNASIGSPSVNVPSPSAVKGMNAWSDPLWINTPPGIDATWSAPPSVTPDWSAVRVAAPAPSKV